MKLDPQVLRDYAIPEVAQRYGPRDCALYALSLGLGQDPLDEAQLRFADATRDDHAALPAMALVLAYPGFWLAQPGTTADPARLVHTQQAIVWHRPVATSGHVASRTRVTDIFDKGEGGHAIIGSERRVADAESGEPLATLTQTHIVRGGGGFGGMPAPPFERMPRPEVEPAMRIDVPTRPEQALLYRLNGDTFALHSSPAHARASGFDRPILHGMCTAGIALQVLLRSLAQGDPARFRRMSLRFTGPVFPGDVLRVEGWGDGAFRVSVPARDAVVIDDARLTLGEVGS
jgi:acyl dehydratase